MDGCLRRHQDPRRAPLQIHCLRRGRNPTLHRPLGSAVANPRVPARRAAHRLVGCNEHCVAAARGAGMDCRRRFALWLRLHSTRRRTPDANADPARSTRPVTTILQSIQGMRRQGFRHRSFAPHDAKSPPPNELRAVQIRRPEMRHQQSQPPSEAHGTSPAAPESSLPRAQ
jgi:hypothetical protein